MNVSGEERNEAEERRKMEGLCLQICSLRTAIALLRYKCVALRDKNTKSVNTKIQKCAYRASLLKKASFIATPLHAWAPTFTNEYRAVTRFNNASDYRAANALTD